ncbi:MAG: LamG-like jellyroll fold domain-containing protein [Candidatus Saelkia tenebricola]|nr:LamG-like jellyroll fold domain-containing protein [Candidatus Saelkia tenebricola]
MKFIFSKLKLKINTSGITLMELIVAIVISSLIGGTFVTVFYKTTNADLNRATEKELERIKESLLAFYKDIGQFPKDSGSTSNIFLDLERVPPNRNRFDGSNALKTWRLSKWDGPYIQDKFNDNGYMSDAWQSDYVYNYTYGNNYCEVISFGADRASGGDDTTIRANAKSIQDDQIRATQDELNIIQIALYDYISATGSAPSTIGDLFEWEVLNMHMDESSWTGAADEVVDYSGAGNHGRAYNGVTTISGGKIGCCGSFDGAADYVGTGENLLNDVSAFSMGGWVYPKSSGNRIGFFGQNNAVGFGFINSSTVSCWTPQNSVSYSFSTLNIWYYFTVVWDGSDLILYVDARQVDSVSRNSHTNSSYAFDIGGGGIWDVSGNYFNGYIDEVCIYNIALSADEILRHYENPGHPRDYFDLHDYAFKYDEWETEYALDSMTAGSETVYYFYSYGPDKDDDSGAADDIKPDGL